MTATPSIHDSVTLDAGSALQLAITKIRPEDPSLLQSVLDTALQNRHEEPGLALHVLKTARETFSGDNTVTTALLSFGCDRELQSDAISGKRGLVCAVAALEAIYGSTNADTSLRASAVRELISIGGNPKLYKEYPGYAQLTLDSAKLGAGKLRHDKELYRLAEEMVSWGKGGFTGASPLTPTVPAVRQQRRSPAPG